MAATTYETLTASDGGGAVEHEAVRHVPEGADVGRGTVLEPRVGEREGRLEVGLGGAAAEERRLARRQAVRAKVEERQQVGGRRVDLRVRRAVDGELVEVVVRRLGTGEARHAAAEVVLVLVDDAARVVHLAVLRLDARVRRVKLRRKRGGRWRRRRRRRRLRRLLADWG